MDEKRVLMVVNPNAGKLKKDKYYNKIKVNLQNKGYIVDMKLTSLENNATHIVKDYSEPYDIIVLCGGDGTLNEANQALFELEKKVPIGFVPCGTTNDYARSLDIPFDRIYLSNNIHKYKNVNVDIGKCNNRIFNYAASFGIFTKTSYNVSYKTKNKYGRLAYVISGIKEAFTYKTYKMKVDFQDKEIEDRFIYGSITNSKSIGGFKVFRKENISLDDGLFEVLLIKKPKNIFHALYIFLKILSGNFKDKNIYFFKADKLHITTDQLCDWALDGEFGGNLEEINISNLNKQAEYIVPVE